MISKLLECQTIGQKTMRIAIERMVRSVETSV